MVAPIRSAYRGHLIAFLKVRQIAGMCERCTEESQSAKTRPKHCHSKLLSHHVMTPIVITRSGSDLRRLPQQRIPPMGMARRTSSSAAAQSASDLPDTGTK